PSVSALKKFKQAVIELRGSGCDCFERVLFLETACFSNSQEHNTVDRRLYREVEFIPRQFRMIGQQTTCQLPTPRLDFGKEGSVNGAKPTSPLLLLDESPERTVLDSFRGEMVRKPIPFRFIVGRREVLDESDRRRVLEIGLPSTVVDCKFSEVSQETD